MLSLWALFLLSAMVITWTMDISSRLALSGKSSRMLEAEAMACSGAEIAMHPQVKPDSTALTGGFGKNQKYEAHLTGEGGRLNINWVTQMPEIPARVEILRKYLENKGYDLEERDRMIDTLLDWVDPDNMVRLNGAEEEEGYSPANRPLQRLDEMKKIKGWQEFTSATNWDADFTLDSQTGQGQPVQSVQPGQPVQAAQPGGGALNLAWASKDIIMALPNVSEDRVDQFLALRQGPDGIDGTEDDGIRSIQEAEVALGLPPGQLNALGVVYNPQEPVWRVISIGRSGEVTRTVQVVFVRQIPPQLKSWKEF
jgi:hypothetical protein